MNNATGELVIQAVGLTKRFGQETVVQDLSLNVPRGQIFGFIGPSGSGKTTTIRLLTGVYRPSEGSVKVLGVPPAQFSRRVRERIGYMPQLFVLYAELTVWENLNFVASLYGMGLIRGKQLNQILELVELKGAKHKLARDISGGMQRRLILAATLVHKPELVFLDEPTAGVDPVLRRKFWDRFRSMRDAGQTLFITTQYVSEATYCDLVGVMANGKLVALDTPQQLRRRAFGGDVIDVETTERVDNAHIQQLRGLPFVKKIMRQEETRLNIVVDDATTATPELLAWFQGQGINVQGMNEFNPPFDDVFVELTREHGDNA